MTDRRPSNDRGYEIVTRPILRDESGMSGMPGRFENFNYLKSDGSEKRIQPIGSRLSRYPDCPASDSMSLTLSNHRTV